MARQKPQKDDKIGQNPTTRDGSAQFINYDFDQQMRNSFKEWLTQVEGKLWEIIDKLIDSGYNLSVKYDSYNVCYSCFVTTRDPDSPHTGFILTGRGRTSINAVAGALYRHYIVFDESWPVEGLARTRATDDD